MDRRKFRRLVEDALDTLPLEIRAKMANVAIVIEDEPTAEQISSVGLDPVKDMLFGLYEGFPLTARRHDFGMALPDRITLFYFPLLETFHGPAAIREQIRRTVVHEVAHFLGLDDDDIEGLGY